MLAGIGAVGGAIAVGVATWLGRNALASFQSQRQLERRMEHAESILASAYQLQTALEAIRSPMSTAHELEQSEKELSEGNVLTNLPAERKDRYVQANVFYIRTRYFDDDFSAAQKLLPLAAAFFDPPVKDALGKLVHNRHVVRVYADAYAQDFGNDQDFDRKIRAAIWKGFAQSAGQDEVTASTVGAVRTLEEHLLPIIRSERSGGISAGGTANA
jgi:hypothetical protein